MGCDTRTASKELEAHIQNGGNLIDIFNRITEAVNNSGFFNQGGRKQPQDHHGKGGKVQNFQNNQRPQNRAQRRQNNKNRGNGNRSQR